MALPAIKHDYFHQSVLQAWLTRTVPAMAVLVALILLAGWLLNRLIRRLVRRRRATAN
jgi:flagellar biogenesis protein FliO